MVRRVLVSAAFVVSAVLLPSCETHAAESLAPIIQLFLDACVPNMGKPDGVRAYAAAHNLTVITDKTLLGAFVGPGPHGAAWLVPSAPPQHYALSIRGTTEACAVWAAQADPQATETQFTKIVEGTARPGIEVKKDSVKTQPNQFGLGKYVMYHMLSPTSGQGFEFTLIINDHSGGLFQASVQVSRVAPH